MRKLFWKVYLPLAICVIMTLFLSVFALTKIIPAQLNSYRNSVEEFRNFVVSSQYHDREDIILMAESLDLEIRVVANAGHLQRINPPDGFMPLPGLPQNYPWRIDLSVSQRGGVFGFLRQGFWLFLLLLLLMEGLVLYFALWPVRKRLGRLRWAASEFGSGNLGVRLHVKEKGDLIDDVGETFNSMAGQIKILLESHQELLGIVAHELRTPMARMRLALELIREDSNDGSLSMIDRMDKDLIALDMLVTELLAFNKLKRKVEILKEEVDLEEICSELIQAESWARDEIEIQLKGSGNCIGDRSLLARTLGNLIRNAVKYAVSKVIVSISIDDNGHSARVSVADDGPGYSPEILDRLGEPFVKDHASSGTGLGLAIAKRITDLHGGTLSFGSSRILGGAEASIRIRRE
ncbi:MAG: HAMP domain-containing histidine kinase [Candidatus Aegiribacteria sp.]|nr:HAMP domain-containing histidine kinase [Candidatus Aegiribacteria sp.]